MAKLSALVRFLSFLSRSTHKLSSPKISVHVKLSSGAVDVSYWVEEPNPEVEAEIIS